MTFFTFSALLNGLVGTLCGTTIIFKNPYGRSNRIIALLCFNIALWSYFYVAWQNCHDAASALFFVRALMMFAIFVPIFHFHHILVLFDLETPYRKTLLKVFYATSILLALSNLTPFFIAGVEQRLMFPYWPIPGPIFHLHVVSIYAPIFFSIYLLIDFRKKAGSPLMRNKLAWLLFGSIIGYVGGGTNYPLWYKIPIPPYLNGFVSIYMLLLVYLFFKIELIDISGFFRNALIHTGTSLAISCFIFLMTLPFSPNRLAFHWILLLSLSAPLLYRALVPFIRHMVQFTRLGQGTRYLKSVDATMEKIRETTYTYDDLALNIVTSMLTTFPVEMAAVYFYDLSREELLLRAQKGMTNPLSRDLKYNRSFLAIPKTDPLMKFIEGKKAIVMRDALESTPSSNPTEKSVRDSMKRIEADICAPFLFAGQVKGILILSRKKQNQMFTKEDVAAIYAFARMGEDIMRYIMGMEAELRHTSLYSHDMNNDTKSLVQTLQFIQSPLAQNQPKERIDKLIRQAEDVADRLNQTFQMNRDRSSLIMKSIRGEYEKEAMDLNKIIRLSCGKFDLQAEKKNISLTIQIPENALMIKANADDFIRVIDNLLANAFRYVSPLGHISVTTERIENTVRIIISDDGEGIDPDDIERIWEMGWQARNAKEGASGFGLSIARQIVHLHNGTIEVHSDGRGKGTRFIILLPLQNSEQKGPVS